QDRARLVEMYAGNPLALHIVAETIVELFGGEIAPFLEQGEVIFGSVRELLAEQFDRLSAVEQTVLLWLAILREPVTIEELFAVLVTPLPRAQVLSVYLERAAVEEHLLALLDQLRTRADYAQGYGPANLLSLLRELRGHLRGLNLSQLAIRGASLQGVEMQDTTLAGASLRETVWTSALDAIWAVATSLNGQYWAAGSRQGEVLEWRERGKLLHLAW